MTIFSVPLSGAASTVERARRTAAGIVHLVPPEYHGDRLRGREAVFAYRTYGEDILERRGGVPPRLPRPGKRTSLAGLRAGHRRRGKMKPAARRCHSPRAGGARSLDRAHAFHAVHARSRQM